MTEQAPISNLDGFTLLSQGYLREGFAAWERRLLEPEYLGREGIPQQGTYPLDVPRWDGPTDLGADGRPMAGKTGLRGEAPTILLWPEQGHGDVLQFVRYAALVAELGASVLVACHPALRRLLSTAKGVSKVYGSWQELGGAKYDLHAPILSLPYIFGTSLGTIPASVPYLMAPAGPLPLDGEFKIGLVWAGNPEHTGDARRSIPLATMLPLLRQPGVAWYSLQVGPASEEINTLGLSRVIQDLSPGLRDFANTASVINNLDLVITVDTAVAHLAGALGKPVWILLPYHADWRWMRGRSDSPWYPTARLFRQQAGAGLGFQGKARLDISRREPWSAAWHAVIQDVALELETLTRRATIMPWEERHQAGLVRSC